jgi:integrase
MARVLALLVLLATIAQRPGCGGATGTAGHRGDGGRNPGRRRSESEAGKRPISLPQGRRADIESHLTDWAEPGPHGRLFLVPQGGIARRRNFHRIWRKALREVGIPSDLDLHLHGLRHTESTWSAQSGATLKELMARIGDSSTRAAMIYQHPA